LGGGLSKRSIALAIAPVLVLAACIWPAHGTSVLQGVGQFNTFIAMPSRLAIAGHILGI